MEKQLLYYQTPDGRLPFRDWLYCGSLEKKTKSIVIERLNRLSVGNPGDYKALGRGVCELRIDFGPGYRIYYAHTGKAIILLLCGGNKKTQKKDIETAGEYWRDYKDRIND
ncbi:MAG: type II toxin-antitoxin system RelE/ParE family toxin [candidate division FCPU426 bacterium]